MIFFTKNYFQQNSGRELPLKQEGRTLVIVCSARTMVNPNIFITQGILKMFNSFLTFSVIIFISTKHVNILSVSQVI